MDSRVQVHQLGPDSQVLRACKFLWRYIHQHGLGPGDHLPTQAELRATTEFSNDTLSRAMGVFMDSGLLTRKFKQGTVLARPPDRLDGLWTVGVAVPRDMTGTVPFYAQLFSFLQQALTQAGCRFQVHLELEHSPLPMRTKSFSDYYLLARDLDAGRLDGVLCLGGLDEREWRGYVQRGIAVCHVGPWEEAPAGACIDRYRMAREAVQLLYARGCRDIHMVCMYRPAPDNNHAWDGFRAGLAEVGLPPRCLACGEGLAAGQLAARRLLAEPQRPDGLLVVDDRIASGLAVVLRDHPDYRPAIAVQTNRQAPLAFALPVIHFEVDIVALAAAACEVLVARMNNPLLPEVLLRLDPVLRDRQPSNMVATAQPENLVAANP